MRNFISRRTLSKVSFPVLLCGVSFFVGLTVYPYLEVFLPGYIVEFVRTGEYHRDVTQTQSSAATRNTFAVKVSEDPVIQEAHKMQDEIIVKLDHNYNALLEGNKPYLETQKKIKDDYALGKKDFPEVRTGMQVEVSQRITEGDKSRVQKFEGVVIKTGGKTHGEKTYTVRRVAAGLGIEKTFPVSCPTVEGVKIIRQYKVNRKNIRYVRGLEGKSARLKEVKAKNAPVAKKTKKATKAEAAE